MEDNDLMKAMQKIDIENQEQNKQQSPKLKKNVRYAMRQTLNGLKKENDCLRATINAMEINQQKYEKCEEALMQKTADCIRLKQLVIDMTNNQNEEKNNLFFRIFECIDCYEKEKENGQKNIDKLKFPKMDKSVQVNIPNPRTTDKKGKTIISFRKNIRDEDNKLVVIKKHYVTRRNLRTRFKKGRKLIPIRRRKLINKCTKKKNLIPVRPIVSIQRQIREYGENSSESTSKQSSSSSSSTTTDAEVIAEPDKTEQIEEKEAEGSVNVDDLKNENPELSEKEKEIEIFEKGNFFCIIKDLNESMDSMKYYHLSHIKELREKLLKKQNIENNALEENKNVAEMDEADQFD